jgi:acyl-CoA synthetase (AMP-forming)/AMP-acid ligase II
MTLNYHLWGHKIVHPSTTFKPKSTLQALVQEKCSDLSGTPEMYSAILTHPDFETSKMSSVKANVLAGTALLEDRYRMVEDEMEAEKVCVGFAETEYGASFLQRPWDNYDRRKNNVGKSLSWMQSSNMQDKFEGTASPRRVWGDPHWRSISDPGVSSPSIGV